MPRFIPRLVVLLILLQASGLLADPASEFEKLFGSELTRVQKTADPADDLQLGRTLLNASSQPDVDPALAAELLKHTCDLAARHRESYNLAIEAALALADRDDTRRDWALRMALDLRQKIYQISPADQKSPTGEDLIQAHLDLAEFLRTGGDASGALDTGRRAVPVASAIRSERLDELRRWVEAATAEAATLKKVEGIQKQLAESATLQPALARQLIHLLVAELDRPDEARKYTFLANDSALVERVRLASESGAVFTSAQHADMGGWYEGLAEAAGNERSRLAMYGHAELHYQQLLAAEDAGVLEKAKATSALGRIQPLLAAAEARETAHPEDAKGAAGWIDLLTQADPNSARGATWNKKGPAITVESGEGRDRLGLLHLPGDLSGGYDLQVKFARVAGATVGVGFPVGGKSTSFVMDLRPFGAMMARGPGALGNRRREIAQDPSRFNAYLYMGLHSIDGKGADDDGNPTRSRSNLSDNKSVLLLIKVRPKGDHAQISVSMNGKTVAQWAGPIEKLSNGLDAAGDFRPRRDRNNNAEESGGQVTLGVLGASAIFQTVKAKAMDGGKITPAPVSVQP